MKKYLVLGVLFILPIVAYVFFASGINNFGKLPVVTENIGELDNSGFRSEKNIDLNGKITVLGFLGDNLELKKTNAFNLNQKIYKRFNGFEDFQFVMIVPEGTQDKVFELKRELGTLADVGNWNFVYASGDQIKAYFNGLHTAYVLDEHLSCDPVFLIDKSASLRGRTDDEDAVNGMLYGYDATSVAVINNKMVDDVKILLAEYRLALKKNNKGEPSKRDSYLKKNQ